MIKNQELFNQLSTLLQTVLPQISLAIKNAFLPEEIKEFPVLSYNSNGFPKISHYPSRADISQFFRSSFGKKPVIDLSEIEVYKRLLSHVHELPEFKSYYWEDRKNPELALKLFDITAQTFIEGFVERYYYLHGDHFDQEKFMIIYLPVETFLYSSKIYFDISIPILFVKFDTDLFELAPNIQIRRIEDEAHRARSKIVNYSPAIASSVYMSATHELVLKDYHYDRPASWIHNPFSLPSIYPLSLIEKFYAVLKIATDHSSGFAQIIVNPKDWAEGYGYRPYLMSLTGASLRSYPNRFDNFFWNHESFPEVVSAELNLIAELYSKAITSIENKLEFALKRFYKSIMREEEEDIIVDLIIALEALLGDNEKSEITHKLALRLAVLLAKYNELSFDSWTVFKNVKRIYDYRSSVVHGNHIVAQKKREIKIADNESIQVVELAKDYLREVLKIVINNPHHLKPDENDKLLLTCGTIDSKKEL